MWHGEHSIVTSATAECIWTLWRDVAGWPAWNAGIATIALHGPFAAGSTFTMTPPGDEPLESRLLMVDPEVGFTDETLVSDVCVTVRNLMTPVADGRLRITYATDVTGPDAATIGEMVTADFPGVLTALRARAEG